MPPCASSINPCPPSTMPLPDPIPPPSPPSFPPSITLMASPMAKESLMEVAAPLVALRLKEKSRGTKRSVAVNDGDRAATAPTSPILVDGRQLAPLKGSSRRIKSSSAPSPSVQPTPGASRESSPVAEMASSPIKRPRTSSLSGDIRNFHLLSSDDESETEGGGGPGGSPTLRCRTRFSQLLGPSPLQKSFSSTAVPQVGHRRMMLERAVTTPPSNTESAIKTRAKVLLDKEEVENLGTELNKVFALVHGKGLGMGSTGGGRHRRGSALRPKRSGDDEDEKEEKWSRMEIDD